MSGLGTKGLSSEDKLRQILNGPDDTEDDEAILRAERRAKNRLRKSSLYGNGARYRPPKTKKKALNLKSPFLSAQYVFDQFEKLEDSAVPPGAHDEQYRMVQYNTKKNLSDPDRVWFATSYSKEGVRAIEQPPWYFGNANKTRPSDSDVITSSARYGYRGSKEIRQFHTKAIEPRERTATEYTPKWLNTEPEGPNEWVPPLFGAPYEARKTSSAMMMSPKLWPKTSEFVNGYPYKERQVTSPQYLRETTAGLSMRPTTTQGIEDFKTRRITADQLLQKMAYKETYRGLMSPPKTAQMRFRNKWDDTVERKATSTLKQTMKREPLIYEASTLMDATDTMRYSGSTAFIVRSQSTDELKFRMRMEKARETIPFKLRWRQVMALYKSTKQRLKRDQTMSEFLQEVGTRLQSESLRLGNRTTLPRMEFIEVMHSIQLFEHVQPKQISLLFSVFDPAKHNIIRFVDWLVAFSVLDSPNDSAVKKLRGFWMLNEKFGNDRSVMELALTILTSCCGNDSEYEEMRSEFKKVFRPACYQSVVLESQEEEEEEEEGGAGGEKMKKHRRHKTDLASQPAYNICDDFLNVETFIQTVEKSCPTLLKLFDAQLSKRLALFHGRDPRNPAPLDDMPAIL